MMHVQSCSLANLNLLFFAILVDVAVIVARGSWLGWELVGLWVFLRLGVKLQKLVNPTKYSLGTKISCTCGQKIERRK